METRRDILNVFLKDINDDYEIDFLDYGVDEDFAFVKFKHKTGPKSKVRVRHYEPFDLILFNELDEEGSI